MFFDLPSGKTPIYLWTLNVWVIFRVKIGIQDWKIWKEISKIVPTFKYYSQHFTMTREFLSNSCKVFWRFPAYILIHFNTCFKYSHQEEDSLFFLWNYILFLSKISYFFLPCLFLSSTTKQKKIHIFWS